MVEKDFIHFTTVTDGCKEVNFMEFSHEYGILDTISLKVLQKIWNFWGNFMKITSLQPSVMVAMGKIYLVTVTHGCEAVIIDEIMLTFGQIEPISYLILQSRFP